MTVACVVACTYGAGAACSLMYASAKGEDFSTTVSFVLLWPVWTVLGMLRGTVKLWRDYKKGWPS